MFPIIDIFDGFIIYIFGLTLSLCFFLFLWMFKKLCGRFGINYTFFLNRVLWYFLSVVFFSRLFYVISSWNDFKFISDPLEFFIMSDYNFSIFGAIFGFLQVLFINLKMYNLKPGKYIDVSVLSFLFVAIIGYVGAFFGGQIYGSPTNIGIEVGPCSNPFCNVPLEVAVFPLALVYSFLVMILFSILYSLSLFVKVRGIIGFTGLIFYGAIILIFETFNGRFDYFNSIFDVLNFNQMAAIIMIIFSFYGLFKIYNNSKA